MTKNSTSIATLLGSIGCALVAGAHLYGRAMESLEHRVDHSSRRADSTARSDRSADHTLSELVTCDDRVGQGNADEESEDRMDPEESGPDHPTAKEVFRAREYANSARTMFWSLDEYLTAELINPEGLTLGEEDRAFLEAMISNAEAESDALHVKIVETVHSLATTRLNASDGVTPWVNRGDPSLRIMSASTATREGAASFEVILGDVPEVDDQHRLYEQTAARHQQNIALAIMQRLKH